MFGNPEPEKKTMILARPVTCVNLFRNSFEYLAGLGYRFRDLFSFSSVFSVCELTSLCLALTLRQ